MAKTDPRRVLQFLLNEWDVVDAIHEHTRRHPLSPRDLRTLAAAGASPRIVDRLLECGVVEPLPNSPAYEMGDVVQQIVDRLKDEHALGLAAEIKVNLSDLNAQTAGVVEALSAPDHEKLSRHAEALQRRIKTIHRQLKYNARALEDMVEGAKTRRRRVPLRTRYAAVLEAWDAYVEPLRIMVDPQGAYEALFERLERELKNARQAIVAHGGLVAERKTLELVQFRLMHLRGELHAHLGETSELLLPLVREIRATGVVARGAAILLQGLRKGVVDGASLAQAIPLSRRLAPNVVAEREFIEGYIAALGEYQPETQPFFAGATATVDSRPLVDAEDVLSTLAREDGVDDVFAWLVERYADIAETDDLLDLYMKVAEGEIGKPTRDGERLRYETNTHVVTAPRLALPSRKRT